MNGYKIVLLKAILCFIGCRKVNGYAPEYVYRFNKTIVTVTIRFILTVAIVVYQGLIPVVYRMLTKILH